MPAAIRYAHSYFFLLLIPQLFCGVLVQHGIFTNLCPQPHRLIYAFVQVEIDETFPKYLRENIDKYQYLLYQKPKWYEFWK